MFNIADFLKRIQGVRGSELAIRGTISDAIRKNAGVDVPVEAIGLKAGRVQLDGISQSARSAIFIKKQGILHDINTAQSIYIINDIS